jgi:hypothetical protein
LLEKLTLLSFIYSTASICPIGRADLKYSSVKQPP